ncbi:hypothetical protein KBB05_00285 [Patescibacteria group bacterium]|nr:hypothetical protein [Patescibacteria group bacterium]
MFSRLTKLLGIKDNATSLLNQGKDLIDQAKSAVNDIKEGGIGLDDLEKAKDHFNNLKDKTSTLVADTKKTIHKAK